MRSTLSLTLIVCLVGSALPVGAQQNSPTVGPLARAITREAARLATVQPTTPVDAGWSRVRRLAPGTELLVTVKGAQSENRYLVAGDESDLTVLNVRDPALPTAARDTLRDLASTHPEHFMAAQKGGQFMLAKHVRVAPEGVFVADQKVADLMQVVETIARNDVAEISGPVPYSPGHEALVGLGVGAAAGGGLALLLCHGLGGCDAGLMFGTAALFGGFSAGISLLPGGYHARHRPWEVIYRAP